jgi:hypothetical protein
MAFTTTGFFGVGQVTATVVSIAGPFSVETQVRVKNLGPNIAWIGTNSGALTPLYGSDQSVALTANETSPPVLLPPSTQLYAVTDGGPAYLSLTYDQ